MQLMATKSYEYQETEGLDWIDGEVQKINPKDKSLKIPHMGWNTLNIESEHPVLKNIHNGDHVYFVHSFHMIIKNQEQRLALHRLRSRYYRSCWQGKYGRTSVSPRKKRPDWAKNDRKFSFMEAIKPYSW